MRNGMDPPAIPSAEWEDRCDRGFPSRKTSDDPVLLPLASLAAMPLIAKVLRDRCAYLLRRLHQARQFCQGIVRRNRLVDTISAEDIERLTSLASH
jgi:hypothetical protein